MPFSPKKHEKLKSPKYAAVSLDSFLGVLSSAYGTEQLDSSIIFEKDTVNWSNISVENLRAIPKREDDEEKSKKEKVKEYFKANAATSTTNLRQNKSEDNEIDETLYSIKSLISLQEIKSKLENSVNEPEHSKTDFGSKEESVDGSLSIDLETTQENEMEESNGTEDSDKSDETRLPPVCGFYVDDSDHKVIFDIQFVKRASLVNEIMPVFHLGEPEISINIADTLKPMKASLKVAKSSLVSKVKYFADVEKEFGLENLDVFVKCNIGVFQWVLQWIMCDIAMCSPSLNITNLKPILSMANHLGIQQLVQECLDFFRGNFHVVLDCDREIEDVFDDKLMLELSKRFSNLDVDQIHDGFESFKTKLFCSLITLLAEPEPLKKVGHFSSLSTMFQCGFCQKILPMNLLDEIPCRADCTEITCDGKLRYHHECSSFWSLTKYIELMHEELKDWRFVYWRLWGMCHFFFCEVCETWYPMSQSECCPYHPGDIEYFQMRNNLLHPIGTHGCCGEKAFKFDTLKPFNGCRYKSHVSKLDTMEKVDKFNIHHDLKQLINVPRIQDYPNIKKFVKLVKKDDFSISHGEIPTENFWWSGILLAPGEKKDYSLIPWQVLNTLRNRPEEKKYPKAHAPLKYDASVSFGRIIPINERSEETDYVEELPSTTRLTQACKRNKPKCNIKKSKPSITTFGPRNKTKKKKSLSYVYQPVESVWTDLESNKDNQDNQRDFEEIAMRTLVQMLTSDGNGLNQLSSAGSYIRLESEWWQRNSFSHMDKTPSTGTVVNRTFPLSWFRRLTI